MINEREFIGEACAPTDYLEHHGRHWNNWGGELEVACFTPAAFVEVRHQITPRS